jgi:hypothetical protein
MSGTFPNMKPAAVAAGGKATVSGRIVGPFQITVIPGDSPSGTGAVTYVPAVPPDLTPVEEVMVDSAGDPLTLDVTAQETRVIDEIGWFSEISVAGADFTLIISDAS